MEFAHENAGDVVVAKLAGRLDSSSAPTAEEQLTRLIGKQRAASRDRPVEA